MVLISSQSYCQTKENTFSDFQRGEVVRGRVYAMENKYRLPDYQKVVTVGN